MNFLGSLGIDLKLLLAQIINFGLLLWFLNKFLYKPIIKRIEQDEAELKRAQTLTARLENEKNLFSQQKKTEMADIKKRSQEIMQKVEKVNAVAKKQAADTIKKEITAIIEQTKSSLEIQKPTLQAEIAKELQKKAAANFQSSFDEQLSVSYRKDIQNILFKDLADKISAAQISKLKEADFIEALEKIKAVDKSDYQNKFKELLKQKIGPIILEYVWTPTPEQKNTLINMASKKIGLDVEIEFKQNKNLILGFRFEIAGLLIESNFLDLISYADRID